MGANKFTAEDLRQFQSLPLNIKVQMTKLRIKWWLDEFDGYVSFSGGKDSTVLLHIARQVDPDIPAVFVDTGLEYPEVREFALSRENVIRLKPEMNFRKVIETYGYPLISKDVAKRVWEYHNAESKGRLEKSCAYKEFNGISKMPSGNKSFFNKEKWKFLTEADFSISHKCCDIMKKKPVKQYEKETGRMPITGTMACESRNRKTVWLRNGCNAYDSKHPISQPMSFWTEQDVLRYIKENNLSYTSVYGDIVEDENGNLKPTGCNRTGCVFCAFGAHLEKEPNRFQRLKQTHPQLWEYCMKDWDDGGLGMKNVLEQINVKIQ